MKKCFKKALSSILAATMLVSSFTVTNVFAAPSFSKIGGWNETIYAEISGIKDADVTGVSYSGTMSGTLTGEDLEYLVRDCAGGVRIDVLGLKPGDYTLTVQTTSGTATQTVNVPEQDRSGFAHFNNTEGVGAYNDDGTLKANAKVLYVTNSSKNTVSVTSSDGTTVTGIGHILNSAGKESTAGSGLNSKGGKANNNAGIIAKLADDNAPIVVRIIGDVTAPDGVTAYDSYDYGGTPNDNGYMVRMQGGKNVTIEGIGNDASINGWGIHFICDTAGYAKGNGKNFEVRNIKFQNVPEDCVGMEGQYNDSTLVPVERCWVHNCSFYAPTIANPAESDKDGGDGACDFKRGQYFTNSYCYYEGYHKTNLVGSGDSAAAGLQYHLTYHHNYWKGCDSRGPLGRKADIHMYNNIFEGQTSYCMNTRVGCYIFSESNLFYQCKNPMVVDSGAIKSYNDSLTGCIESANATFVTDKSQKVSSGNAYENFDTNSSMSYIPSGDYILQEDLTEAKKVVLAYAGTQAEDPITPDEVNTSMLASDRQPTASVQLPYDQELNSTYLTDKSMVKDNIIFNVYKNAGPVSIGSTTTGQDIVFNVNQPVNITITDGGATYPVVLMNDSGVEYLTGSGTAYNVPAGTYMIQSSGFQPAKGTTPAKYKEAKISHLSIVAADSEAPTVAEPTTQATTAADPSKPTEATTTAVDPEEPTEETTSAPYTGEGLVWNYTDKTNTLNATVDANDWSNATPVTYNGSTFTEAIKFESSTNISFTVPGSGNLTLVTYSSSSAPYVLVNGEKVTVNKSGAVTIPASGTVNITKGSSSTYLYLMEFVGDGETSTEITTQATTEATTQVTTEATTQVTTEVTTEITTSAPVEGVQVAVDTVSAKVGDTITVPVKVTGLDSLSNYQLTVAYDNTLLNATKAENGDIVNASDADFLSNITAGQVSAACINPSDTINKNGTVLLNITFTVLKEGTATLTLNVGELNSANLGTVEFTTVNGTVTITEDTPITSIRGDVNKDGKVNAADAAIVLRIASGIITDTTPYDMVAADCNVEGGDGKVDILDAIWILSDKTVTTTESSTEVSTEESTESSTEISTDESTESTTAAVVQGQLYKFYVNADDAAANGDVVADNATAVFTNAATGTGSLSAASTITVDGKSYTLSKRTSNGSQSLTIVVPSGVTNATLYLCANSSGSGVRTLTLADGANYSATGSVAGTSGSLVTFTGLNAGTYTLTSSGNWGYSFLALSTGASAPADSTTESSTESTTTTVTTTTVTTTTVVTEVSTEATTTATVADGLAAGTYTLNKVNAVTNTITGLDTSAIYSSDSGAIKLRDTNYITIVPSISGTISITWSSNAPKAVLVSGGTETEIGTAASSPFSFSVTAGQTYKVYGTKSGGNTNLEQLVLSNGSGEIPTEATTSSTGTDNTSESTTTDLSGAINIAAGDATSLETALKNATAGQVINLAAGNYAMSSAGVKLSKTATAAKPITITCSNGYATLDFDKTSSSTRGVTVSGAYYNLSNLVVKNSADNGMYITGDHVNVENCIFEANGDTGLQISAGGSNVLVKNCTSFNNIQPENADGFAAKLGVGENVVFDGCISYCNSDDGWDLYSKSGDQQNKYPITLRNCIAFNNGFLTDGTVEPKGDRNGFKLGGLGYSTANVVENCIAFGNGACGFTDNNNPGLAVLKNCTGYKNALSDVKKHNFSVYRATEDLKMTNCLSYVLNADTNGGMDRFQGTSDNTTYNANATVINSVIGSANKYYKVANGKITNNTDAQTVGTEVTISDSDFESMTLPYTDLNKVHEQMRNADGSIKLNGFLQPKAGSVIDGIGAKFN